MPWPGILTPQLVHVGAMEWTMHSMQSNTWGLAA